MPRVSVWHHPSVVAGISTWQHSGHLLEEVCRIYQKAHRPSPQRCRLEEERREGQTEGSRSGSPGRMRGKAGWAGSSAPRPAMPPLLSVSSPGPSRLPVTQGTNSEPDAGFLLSLGGSSGPGGGRGRFQLSPERRSPGAGPPVSLVGSECPALDGVNTSTPSPVTAVKA